MSKLGNLLAKFGDELEPISDGNSTAEFDGYLDTGSYALNAVISGTIYGGIPNNKIFAFAGDPATGKTFFALQAVKTHLEENEENVAWIFDTESAITKDMLEDRGIDSTRVFIEEPISIEEFRHTIINIVDTYSEIEDAPRAMMVLDSLGNLSSNKELQDTKDGKDTRDMTKAQLLRGTFRVITKKLAKAKIPLIINNHTYAVVGAYVPTKEMAGGGGLKYCASSIGFLSKKKDRDGKTVVGNFITVTMAKNRFAKEDSKVDVHLSFEKGLGRYEGLLDIADLSGALEKKGNNFMFPHLPEKSYPGKTIYKDPAKFFTDEVLEAIDKGAHSLYAYGKSEEISTDEEDDLE